MYFKLNLDSIGDPDMYLGSKVGSVKPENGGWAWALIPSQYVQESCQNVQKYLEKNLGRRWKLPSTKQVPNLFTMGYTPELYVSTVIDPSSVSYYQFQMGVLRWMFELGWVDINTEVSMLASCLYLPR